MTSYSWNEIRDNAIAFSRRWCDATREAADKQTFWNEFFAVFGRDRRAVAAFEYPVKNIRGARDFIDLFWPGALLVEHKSAGKPLGTAESQAFNYIAGLAREGRFDEMPRYVILSDFQNIALYDLQPEEQLALPLFEGVPYSTYIFPLGEFHHYVRHFAFIKGEQTVRINPEDPANRKAFDLMCDLHDALAEQQFARPDLEIFLVRVLFCLFADNTEVFEPLTFATFIETQTNPNGSDLGARLNELFDVLNTPDAEWGSATRKTFAGFRYINGDLFDERLRFPQFTRDMRDSLLAACRFHWGKVSPVVFGSIFQGVLNPKVRRQKGEHYTSERDIMKVIRPLFLDTLQQEFETIQKDASTRRKVRLNAFHDKLRSLRFLDPACGCGNFLVLAYRELRLLELDVLKAKHANPSGLQTFLDVRNEIRVDVDQFYGIEISEWPCRIAEVAMWLMDHQMNREVSISFGRTFERLPLRATPHIHHANALRLNWESVLPSKECSYILGNPPFVGAKFQDAEQRNDVQSVATEIKNRGLLDYVAMWYIKATDYIRGTEIAGTTISSESVPKVTDDDPGIKIRCAFVSTNSICQGEQVAALWQHLFDKEMTIIFAYRTFPWESEARGKAHVHVVIIGFTCQSRKKKHSEPSAGGTERIDFPHQFNGTKTIYEETDSGTTCAIVSNISPYLVEGGNFCISNRSTPLCDAPKIAIGNKPIDGGHYLFTPKEKNEFLHKEPAAEKYFRRWLGAEEFINGMERWCLLLQDCSPASLRAMPECLKRVETVRTYRKNSKSLPTQKLSKVPTRFHVENFPKDDYLFIPKVSSETRKYIPIGFLSPSFITSDLAFIIPNATLYHFGVLTSLMHMVWIRAVGGRLKSDYRYSAKLIYNNFPWPNNVSEKQRAAVERAAQSVLDARIQYLPPKGDETLADLYHPLAMPVPLVKAHAALDIVVEKCYRPHEKFKSDAERIAFLFTLYQTFTTPLLPVETGKKKRKRRNNSKL